MQADTGNWMFVETRVKFPQGMMGEGSERLAA